MALADDLRRDFHDFTTVYGKQITIVDGFTQSYSGAGYDQVYLSSGTTVSGVINQQPFGPSDNMFLQQGILSHNDKKVFVHGSLAVTQDAVFVVNGSRHSVLNNGIELWEVSGVPIYQRVYLRMWPGGGSPAQYI